MELKPARKKEEGYYQNIQQMLSKLFFSELLIYLQYQMSVIVITKKDGICLKRMTLTLYDEENKAKLDLKILNPLYEFIYCIFKWAMTTRCKFTNAKTSKFQVTS